MKKETKQNDLDLMNLDLNAQPDMDTKESAHDLNLLDMEV